jgi:hypothetical protein
MPGRSTAVFCLMLAACFIFFLPEQSQAVTSYSHRYNVGCSACHTTWGALNGAGVTFRLSGYRAIFGKDLTPASKDVAVAGGAISLPSAFPLSLITGFGAEYRNEKRESSSYTSTRRTGSTLALEDASIFLSSPLGKHLSAFIEFPMYETKAWEFTPTGPAEANDITAGKNIKFRNESIVFEVAKFWWNNLIPGTPRDSVNLSFGISHPPLAYSPGKVRLSVNQYLIYDRRALDLISPKFVSPDHDNNMLSNEPNDYLFRLSEPQVFFELNGMLVPGKDVTAVSKRSTVWMEYHVGVANGSNGHTDNNSAKDFYGCFITRYYNQSLGIFFYRSPDTYDDSLRNDALVGKGGVLSARRASNRLLRIGPDMTLSMVPLHVPVWIENQYMYNRESDPTGFGKEFKWQGGFHQLNWQINPKTILYNRYDWVRGNRFDDTASTILGVSGVIKAKPREWDVVSGLQYLFMQNLKLTGEYRHHEFEDEAGRPHPSHLQDDGFTVRAMIAF